MPCTQISSYQWETRQDDVTLLILVYQSYRCDSIAIAIGLHQGTHDWEQVVTGSKSGQDFMTFLPSVFFHSSFSSFPTEQNTWDRG